MSLQNINSKLQARKIIKTKLNISSSKEDWKTMRECYVKAFFNYPLYIYVVPDPEKREEFLRSYLDANFEATVGSGKGMLITLSISNNRGNIDEEMIGKESFTIIGGIMLIFPGYLLTNDSAFWKAYEDHKLGDISPMGFSRLKKYEAWENNFVCNTLLQIDAPIMNGIFCGIHPKFASQGLGRSHFDKSLDVISHFLVTQKKQIPEKPLSYSNEQKVDFFLNNAKNLTYKKANNKSKFSSHSNSLFKNKSQKNKHFLQNFVAKTNAVYSHDSKLNCRWDHFSSDRQTEGLLLVGICQNPSSENFYTANGLQKMLEVTYTDGEYSFPVSLVSRDLVERSKTIKNMP